MGAIETLICWENLDIQTYIMKNPSTQEQKIFHLTKKQEQDKTNFLDEETGLELKVEETLPFLEWLSNNR